MASQHAAAQVRETPNEEREQRRQMALRHIRQYPDPVLRRKAEKIETFDDELKALLERMWSIMDEAYGVGLAAPQLGLLLQVFTYRMEDSDEPQALINPTVTWSSDETDVDDEGCLSLSDVRVPVERPTSVKVSAHDVEGNDVELEFAGFPARVVQHEIDHLNGVLMIDRAADEQARRQAMGQLRPRP